MKKRTYLPRVHLLTILLVIVTFIAGCHSEEQEIFPQQNCDTQAVIRELTACGPVLTLKNGQILVPVNAITLPAVNPGLKQYKINGFTVQEGQQVIIGYTNKEQATDLCLKSARLAEITCIVGYQTQP